MPVRRVMRVSGRRAIAGGGHRRDPDRCPCHHSDGGSCRNYLHLAARQERCCRGARGGSDHAACEQKQQECGCAFGQLPSAPFLPIWSISSNRDLLQLDHECCRVRWSSRRVLCHAPPDKIPQGHGYRFHRDRRGLMLTPQLAQSPGKRRLAGQALKEHGCCRVDVGGRGGFTTCPLFWRHVQRRADRPTRRPARTAIPKSASLLLPEESTSTFSGL